MTLLVWRMHEHPCWTLHSASFVLSYPAQALQASPTLDDLSGRIISRLESCMSAATTAEECGTLSATRIGVECHDYHTGKLWASVFTL